MHTVAKLRPDWPSTVLNLTTPITVEHAMRILLDHGGRFVECAPEYISYPPGEMTFTLHRFTDDEGVYYLFADQHGWALHERAVMKLIEEGVLYSDFSIK